MKIRLTDLEKATRELHKLNKEFRNVFENDFQDDFFNSKPLTEVRDSLTS